MLISLIAIIASATSPVLPNAGTAVSSQPAVAEPTLFAQVVETTPSATPSVPVEATTEPVTSTEAPAADSSAPMESETTVDSILSEPLPSGDTLSPDSSLLMDSAPLPSIPGEMPLENMIQAPPKPKFGMAEQIKFRKLRTKIDSDPALRECLERARTAKTDYEKREALKQYYTGLFKKLNAADKGLAEEFKELETQALYQLEQHRVAPTEVP